GHQLVVQRPETGRQRNLVGGNGEQRLAGFVVLAADAARSDDREPAACIVVYFCFDTLERHAAEVNVLERAARDGERRAHIAASARSGASARARGLVIGTDVVINLVAEGDKLGA